MNLSYYIARRYFFSKKSQNIISIISKVSVGAVTVGTMALIIVISAFNGIDGVVKSMFSDFDPDAKVEIIKGKSFSPDSTKILQLQKVKGIKYFSYVFEDDVLLRFENNQEVATLKGVDRVFEKHTPLNNKTIEGKFKIYDHKYNLASIGSDLATKLKFNPNFISLVQVYAPKNSRYNALAIDNLYEKKLINATSVFSVKQIDIDSKYILSSLNFAQTIFKKPNKITGVEIYAKKNANIGKIISEVKNIFDKNTYSIKDRYQLHDAMYKMMKSEKMSIFFILIFIIIIASFNIVASVAMLITEKKKDIATLINMGATEKLIKKIFLFEGWIITVLGVTVGLVLGLLVCYIQKEFGIIKFSDASQILKYYPIKINIEDIIYIILSVLTIGFLFSFYPIRHIRR